MASAEVDIVNMALGRIGEKRLTAAEYAANTEVRAQHATLHYAQCRDALLRSHSWRFARGRAELTANETDPDFEWTYAYDLPADFLAMRSIYEDNETARQNTVYSYALEGNQLLFDESTCEIRYVKKVTTVTSFDPLFVEVLVLQLAMKLIFPLAGAGRVALAMYESMKNELWGTPRKPGLMSKVRAMDRQETETLGRDAYDLWIDARWSNNGRIDSKLGGS